MTNAPSTAVVPFQPPADHGTTIEMAPEAWKLACRVAGTEFVPKALRDKPEAVLACILAGHEAGLSPMTSLRSIHVIEGRPAMSAELMRAIVARAGHEVWVEESTSTRAIVAGKRNGSSRELKVTWTEDDARRAGLLGKENWKKYPRAMLVARASTELARYLFPDVLAGISHSIEELADAGTFDAGPLEHLGPPETGPSDAAHGSPPTRTARADRAATSGSGPADPGDSVPTAEAPRGDIPGLPGEDDESDIVDAEIVDETERDSSTTSEEAKPEDPQVGEPSYASERREMEAPPLADDGLPAQPEFDIDDDDPPPAGDPGPRLSGAQVIAIRFAEHGITDRPGKLRWVAQLIGRTLGTTNDLTPEETRVVIDFLDALPEGQQLEQLPAEDPAADGALAQTEPERLMGAGAPASAPARSTSVTPPEEWPGERWREFLKARKLKVAPVLKEAARLGAERDPAVMCGTLDDLAGSGLCSDLVAWCEEQ